MKKFNYTVQDQNGIHARPAGLLVREAQKFSSEIKLSCGEKTQDLKRLFSIMGMGIKHGDQIEVEISGPDEDLAASALEEFIKATI